MCMYSARCYITRPGCDDYHQRSLPCRSEFAALATMALTTTTYFLNATYTDGDTYTQPTISKFYECWIPTCTHSYILIHITSVCEHCRRGVSTNPFLSVDFSTSLFYEFITQVKLQSNRPTCLSSLAYHEYLIFVYCSTYL